MDFIHCDDYEMFLQELAFGENNEKLNELHAIAVSMVQPLEVELPFEEELAQDMDDCWDSEWINPLTGIPHYVAANWSLTGTSVEPTLIEQVYSGANPEISLTEAAVGRKRQSGETTSLTWASKWGVFPTRFGGPPNKKCTFCVNKFGECFKANTHTVKYCKVLANMKCLKCGKMGHTTSYCRNTDDSSISSGGSYSDKENKMTLMDKAGGITRSTRNRAK